MNVYDQSVYQTTPAQTLPPGGGTPVPPSPTAGTHAGSVYTTPIPGVTDYLQSQLLAKTAYENALARLSSQRSGILRTAGYTGTFNSDGTIGKLSVDTHNPYGQYQMTRRGDAMQDVSTQNAVQGRGLLNSGIGNRAMGENRYVHQGVATQQASSLLGSLSDIAGQQQGATNEYNSALWQAQLQAAQNAIMNQQFNPVLNAPGAVSPQDAAVQAATNAAGPSRPPDAQARPVGPARYYTYKTQVQLKPGQTLHYTPGRGYYAA